MAASGRTDQAAYLVLQLYGHETAHLDPVEQLQVAAEVIRELTLTITEIAEESLTPSSGDEKHGA